jgi:HEAT repeat protein
MTILQLTQLLQDSDPAIRGHATSALGKIGKSGKTAISKLLPLLHDMDLSVRGDATEALYKLGYKRQK